VGDNGHPRENIPDQLAESNELRRQLKETSRQLKEANNIIAAIRDGEIDALLVSENKKDQVYILQGADLVYREIVEEMQEGYVTLGKDGVILFCNRNFARLLRRPLEQVIGSSIYELLPPAEMEFFQRSLAREDIFKREFSLTATDGLQVPVLFSANCCFEKMQFVYVVVTDLTEQKRCEQQFMHRVFEQAGEAIIVCDVAGKIIRVNKVTTELFGADLLQHKIDQTLPLFVETDEKPFLIQRALRKDNISGIEARYSGRDGKNFNFLISAGWLNGMEPGERIGFIVTLADISQQKLAEERTVKLNSELQQLNATLEEEVMARQAAQAAVQREKDLLSSLLNNISDEIWFADRKKHFTFANPAAVREFRLDSESNVVEELASSLEVLRPDGSPRPIEEAPPLRALQGEVIMNQQEIIRTPEKGELRYREVCASPIRDVDGSIIGSVAVVRDITERRQTEEALKVANIKLTEASKAKSGFLSSMSHEFRTPLNVIIGFSEVLQDQLFGQLNEKQTGYVKNIENSGRHLLSLINDILDIGKVEANKIHLELTRVNFAELCTLTVASFNEIAKKQQITLSYAIDSNMDDVLVDADERKIKQILYNLIGNGIKFNRPHGTVAITMRKTSGILHSTVVEIVVEDTGIGIAEEDREKLFLPFSQLAQTINNAPIEGTGLGLALTKHLVELHGGEISVESEFGKGSRFIVLIPIRGGNRHEDDTCCGR